MSNDIKQSADTAVATATNVAENLLRYGRGAANRTFIGDLMLFSKYGEYRAGQDKLETPLRSRFSVYIDSFCIGWQRWEDGRVVEQEMGPVTGGYIPRARKELGHLDKSKWESFEDGRDAGEIADQEPMAGRGNDHAADPGTIPGETAHARWLRKAAFVPTSALMPLIDRHIHFQASAPSQTLCRAYTLSKNSWSARVLELARGRRHDAGLEPVGW